MREAASQKLLHLRITAPCAQRDECSADASYTCPLHGETVPRCCDRFCSQDQHNKVQHACFKLCGSCGSHAHIEREHQATMRSDGVIPLTCVINFWQQHRYLFYTLLLRSFETPESALINRSLWAALSHPSLYHMHGLSI